ncbi:MAG: HD domain-containing phosphohydrolase [Planctomycetota bacterium]
MRNESGIVGRVLAVDDDEAILRLVESCLRSEGYDLRFARSGEEALVLFGQAAADVVLVDIGMPGMGGLALIDRLRKLPGGNILDIIVVTGEHGVSIRLDVLREGVIEIIHKPYDVTELVLRVRNAFRRRWLMGELDDAEAVLLSLARMVEARDGTTGDHCERLLARATALGKALGVGEGGLDMLRKGAVLHDIGKIAVPDAILLAPRKLTSEEWTVMKAHPATGEALCRSLRSVQSALPVIRSHHERWDGSGYPDGLKGDAIPRGARIFQMADVFDALTSRRPYKEPMSVESAIDVMREEECRDWYEPGSVGIFADVLRREEEEEKKI